MSDGDPPSARSWVFGCRHPDYVGVTLDYSEFAIGATEARASGANNWQGGFSGRPELLADLMPTIVACHGGRTPRDITNLKGALRAFWRFLDAYEAWLQAKGQVLPKIRRLHQLTGVLLELFSQPGPDQRWVGIADGRAYTVRALIAEAIHEHELPTLHMAAISTRRPPPKDTPSDEAGLSLVRHLRGEVAAIFRRWQRADQLAQVGRDLVAIYQSSGKRLPSGFRTTEADAHATYRAMIARTGEVLPMVRDLPIAHGSVTLPPWWPSYSSEQATTWGHQAGDRVSWADCIAGLYPSSADVATCALLCLARSAWNPATLLSLDLDNWWSAYDQDHAWIFARKDRAGGVLQHTIGPMSHPTGVFRVITRLAERNAPLRAWIAGHRDSVAKPEIALRSPWIGSSNNPAELIFVADPRSTGTLNNWLRHHITKHNRKPGIKVQVPAMSCSDFRDIAAAIMYRESRYSLWVLMLMLGHRNIATTRAYGYRHAGRQESHRLVAKVVGDTLGQIAETRTWDPTLTRARVEGIAITPDALARLEAYRKNRTYSGAVCADPGNPPVSIDPTHPQDGKTRCAQGHLCVARACPRALVLNDSLSDICKTTAELEWRQLHTGTVRFDTGSEAEDLAYLRKTLSQWPKEEVDVHLARWRDRIERGEHLPILFGGQH